MTSKRLNLFALFFLALGCVWSSAQSAATAASGVPPGTGTPEERLRRAAELSSLDAITSKPWHLKIAIAVFDDAGKNPQNGSVEVWRSNQDSRTVYTFGDSSDTEVSAGGKHYVGSSGTAIPDAARTILQRVLTPGPVPLDYTGTAAELRRETFGKQPFDCIMLTVPLHKSGVTPLGLFPTYCLLHDTDDLRITYNLGSEVVIHNGFGVFLGHQVTTNLSISSGRIETAKAKVMALTTFTPDANDFVPAEGLKEVGTGVARIGGGVMAGSIISKVPPVYPDSAKIDRVSGTVVLHAIIGRDGHIRSLRVVSTPDADLAIASLVAVRQWRYKPYLLNGEPTQVDTTITVNFNLGRG